MAVDKQGQGLFQYAQVEPVVNVDELEEVLVTLGPVVPEAPPPLVGPELPASPTGK